MNHRQRRVDHRRRRLDDRRRRRSARAEPCFCASAAMGPRLEREHRADADDDRGGDGDQRDDDRPPTAYARLAGRIETCRVGEPELRTGRRDGKRRYLRGRRAERARQHDERGALLQLLQGCDVPLAGVRHALADARDAVGGASRRGARERGEQPRELIDARRPCIGRLLEATKDDGVEVLRDVEASDAAGARTDRDRCRALRRVRGVPASDARMSRSTAHDGA